MPDAYVGERIRVCHKQGTVRENPAEDDTYLIELELGGVHQEIVVTESYIQDSLGDAR